MTAREVAAPHQETATAKLARAKTDFTAQTCVRCRTRLVRAESIACRVCLACRIIAEDSPKLDTTLGFGI